MAVEKQGSALPRALFHRGDIRIVFLNLVDVEFVKVVHPLDFAVEPFLAFLDLGFFAFEEHFQIDGLEIDVALERFQDIFALRVDIAIDLFQHCLLVRVGLLLKIAGILHYANLEVKENSIKFRIIAVLRNRTIHPPKSFMYF